MNLALRFILELIAWFVPGWWAWVRIGWWAGVLFPLILAFIWSAFAVPGDKSRSGKTLVVTPGPIRLVLETTMFLFGAWCLYALGKNGLACATLALIVVHHLFSVDRIRWLLTEKLNVSEPG